MTGMLASVVNLAEARIVAAAGVDIIDLKDPAAGALGALPVGEIKAIVDSLSGDQRISATLGDLPMQAGVLVPAVEAMAATGVDFVKIGFFPGGDWSGVVGDLRPAAADGIRLVAVLFGDSSPDLGWVTRLAEAGFEGVMLDTADKRKGSLRTFCNPGFLRDFVATTRRHGLLTGLAGSLRAEDVPSLLALDPDYLGFRGGLCRGGRSGALDPDAVIHIRELTRSCPKTARQPPAT